LSALCACVCMHGCHASYQVLVLST
jgi:hypothetical protein